MTITRALAFLNGYVHELMRDNPGLVVESVSHTQFIHQGQAQMSVPARLWFFATIVYSGEITDVQRLAYYDTREKQLPFDSNAPAYGSVIYVEL